MSDALLITGATSEIGLEVAKLLAPGATFLAHCRDRAGLDTLSVARPDLNVVPLIGDLSNRDDVTRIADAVVAREERVTGVVHLAAPKLALKRFRDLDWADLDRSLEVQVHAIGRILQRILPAMAKAGGGSVVLVLSSVTFTPPAFMSDYVIAKHALLGMTRALSAEYVAKGVRVNAVSPSMTRTKFLDDLAPQVLEATADKHPMKRHATPAEVANVIHFLLSPQAAFVSGTNLAVTGGEVG